MRVNLFGLTLSAFAGIVTYDALIGSLGALLREFSSLIYHLDVVYQFKLAQNPRKSSIFCQYGIRIRYKTKFA